MDDVQRLGPRIHEILTSPNTDLDSISAKRIRKQLQDEDPLVTPDFIRNNKAEIDNLITTIFEAVRANTPWTPAATSTSTSPKIRSIAPPLPKPVSTPTHAGVKRKLEETTRTESSPAFPLAKRVTSSKLSDAEIARQLDAQINGHTTRSGSVSSKRSGKGKKQKKSKEEVDDSDAEEDGNGSGEVPVKKKRGGGFQKPYALRYATRFNTVKPAYVPHLTSPALAVLTGESQVRLISISLC